MSSDPYLFRTIGSRSLRLGESAAKRVTAFFAIHSVLMGCLILAMLMYLSGDHTDDYEAKPKLNIAGTAFSSFSIIAMFAFAYVCYREKCYREWDWSWLKTGRRRWN